jgi:hypothetical protein
MLQAPINFVIALRTAEEFGALDSSAVVNDALAELARHGAQTVEASNRRAVLAAFDADQPDLLRAAARLVARFKASGLRIAMASGVKERPVPGAAPRMSERSLAQARGLLDHAGPGEVLLSSQLGSLLMVSGPALASWMRAARLTTAGSASAQAYQLDVAKLVR